MKYLRRWYALFLLLASTDAWATTRYVSPTGDGGVYTFATPGGLDSANIVSAAGDVVQLLPGTYTTAINPTNNGNQVARIRYIGNVTRPDSVVVPTFGLTKRNITVTGVRVNGTFSLGKESSSQFARCDSLSYSQVTGSIYVGESKACKIYQVEVTGALGLSTFFIGSNQLVTQGAVTMAESIRVSRCTMTLGANVLDGKAIARFFVTSRDTVDSCTIAITLSHDQVGEVDPFMMNFCHTLRFFDNKWTVVCNWPGDRLFRLRDSTNATYFLRDTLIFSGQGNVRFAPNSSGDVTAVAHANRFDYMVIRNSTQGNDYAVWFQGYAKSDTMMNCAVVSDKGKALFMAGIDTTSSTRTTTVFDHNTFVGFSPRGSASPIKVAGAFHIEADRWVPQGKLVFTNNIVVVRPGADQLRSAIGYFFQHASDQLTSNNNLYYNFNGVVADAIGYKTVGDGNSNWSYPGLGSPFSIYKPGQEGYSKWGNPLLTDYSADNFDPALLTGSPARSAGTSGTDIGATGDAIRPYVLTMSVGAVADNQVTLAWTATGDDSLQGTVASYDIRYSTSTIDDEAEWAAATQLSGEPTPLVAGTTQNYRVTGLTNNTTYYFVIRATDEAGNQSALSSNVCAYPPYFCAD